MSKKKKQGLYERAPLYELQTLHADPIKFVVRQPRAFDINVARFSRAMKHFQTHSRQHRQSGADKSGRFIDVANPAAYGFKSPSVSHEQLTQIIRRSLLVQWYVPRQYWLLESQGNRSMLLRNLIRIARPGERGSGLGAFVLCPLVQRAPKHYLPRIDIIRSTLRVT